MDAAKYLAQWQEQSPEQWVRTVNRYLPTVAALFLVVGIAYQLSRITWTVVPGAVLSATPAPTPGARAPEITATSATFATLLDSHLFGEAPKETAPQAVQEVEAPDTMLSLTLTGILSTEGDPGGGLAAISSNRGQEKNYDSGQQLDDANGTTLHSVYADHVLLNRGNRLETLRLPKSDQVGAAGGAGTRAPRPALAPTAARSGNDSLGTAISQNASRLAEIVSLAPHMQEGRFIGFRANPGRDREGFETLGLLPGDVVTDINGVVLDDATRGLQALQALGEATIANVTVLREGTRTVLVIDTSQLQKLEPGDRGGNHEIGE